MNQINPKINEAVEIYGMSIILCNYAKLTQNLNCPEKLDDSSYRAITNEGLSSIRFMTANLFCNIG
ncbi:MAG: hypothetical protein EVG15_10330 [Candidatus Acididesulfobacter diazotrophicus]|uniref:Uncharacterized protein n=1 Tax=Candidatus Acididesulfobacter diazotrophicus TaxID=2597226 RepID=A0A519BJZ9_9DELT|nr:MAG: hypothetical protein EVG15_10330 [Candidatus Acididesulfobacter diazotrophicus]